MASDKNRNPLLLLVLAFLFLSLLQHCSVSSFEYQVGGIQAEWVVPPSNDTTIYNNWASENRFQVGDTIRFKYRKDSVMEVSKDEYKKCSSTRPGFFSNNGNTVFKLSRSGSFFFISGASGHCEKGQKMIVKVMALDGRDDDDSDSSHASDKSMAPVLLLHPFMQLLTINLFSLFLFFTM